MKTSERLSKIVNKKGTSISLGTFPMHNDLNSHQLFQRRGAGGNYFNREKPIKGDFIVLFRGTK